jgi:Na+/melibiose symporter-like transporter
VSASDLTRSPIGRGRIVAFGSVQLPLGAIGLPIAIYLAPLYSGQLHLGLQTIGFALILARLSDFVIDPLIGIVSDRWRPSIGRRRVWLIFGSATLLIGVFLLFRPAPGVGIIYFGAAITAVYLGFSLIQLPYNSWAAELSPDYHLRTKISSVSQFFSIMGLIASTLIPAYVLTLPGMTTAQVMSALSLFVFVTLPLCSAAAFFLVPEPELPIKKVAFHLRSAVRALVSNRAFLCVTFVVLIATVGEVFRQTITVFFARDVVGVTNIGVIYFFYFLAALALVPAWVWLARKLEKHRALMLALVIVAITNALMFFVPKGGTAMFVALFVLKGACYGGVLTLPGAMVADTVDIDTAETLDRQQGLFFAAIAMVQKMGYALGAGLPLLILGAFGYNSAGEDRVRPLMALTVSYSLIPSILVLVAAALSWRYTLTAARHRTIRAEIEARARAAVRQGVGTGAAA